MQRSSTLLSVCLSLTLATTALGEEPAWFDCASCTICQPMAENPAMMQDMKWEAHKVAAGMVMTTVIPASLKADFAACCAKMKETAESLAGDEPLCGFCAAYGDLLTAGAKEERFSTGFGEVSLVTSDDPSVVAKIHAHADRSAAEMEKMLASIPTAELPDMPRQE